MKSMFVMSVMGQDNPGTIKSIADLTREFGGEWLRSKVNRLDGQFTAIMKVHLDQDQELLLQSALRERFTSLQFTFAPLLDPQLASTKNISLLIDCRDRPGLTRELSRVLTNLDLVVEDMECNRVPVATIGQTAFTARVALAVPEQLSAEAVAEEIESLGEDMRVTVL